MKWIDDGHRITITFEQGGTSYELTCPVDVEGRAPTACDECRVEYDEHGDRIDGPPLPECNFKEYLSEQTGGIPDYLVGVEHAVVDRVPYLVQIAWDGDGYVWKPSARTGTPPEGRNSEPSQPDEDELRRRLDAVLAMKTRNPDLPDEAAAWLAGYADGLALAERHRGET